MFKLIKKIPLLQHDGVGLLYRHDKTSMEVFSIENSCEELSCAFTFATPSEDSTGLAHILEHTVLSGSEKYPVKDPFSELYLSSPNTFLNAMTFCDKTMYPFSSPLKKDFDIIFDIYADAVFAPLLRRQSFEQEGVRFYNGKVDGVVFNEMTGARSSEDSIVNTFCVNKLFKDTPYQYDSGGDPVCIADLTYQDYLNRYRLWYNPSNCRLFLYGKLNTQEYLDKIEKNYLTEYKLSAYEGQKITTSSEPYYKSAFENLRDRIACPTKDAYSVVLTWLTKPADDPLENMTLSVLTDILLGNCGAPLYKAITDSGLGEDLNPMSGMDSEYPILPFTVGFVGAKKAKEDQIESFLIDTLRQIAENRIDDTLIDAALKQQAFKIKEIQGGSYPYGIITAMRCARYWLRGKEPQEGLFEEDTLNKIRQKVMQGRYFENWIMDNLVNNNRRCLLTVYYDEKSEKNRKKILEKKYNDYVENTDAKQYRKDKEQFEKFVNKKDSKKELNRIPRITRKDMPKKVPSLDLKEAIINNVPVKKMVLKTRGITYLNVAFDVTYLNKEEKILLPLLVRALQMCSTKMHSYAQIGTQIKSVTGGFSIIQSCASKVNGQPFSFVMVKTKCLDEQVQNTYNLVLEIILESIVTEKARVKAAITDLLTDFESSYLESANAFATINSSSGLSAIAKESELSIGTENYLFLKKLKNAEKKLENLRKKIFTKDRMIIEISCEENSLKTNIKSTENFIGKIPETKSKKDESFYTNFKLQNNTKTKISVSSGPAYNSVSFSIKDFSEDQLVSAMLYASIISSSYLFDAVRGKNGAYGAECHVDMQEKIFSMSSYRDPSIDSTYDIFEQALNQKLTKRDIDYTVVTIIGKELRPLIPKIRCIEAFRRSLFGMTDKMYLQRRKMILSKTPEDMKNIAGLLLNEYKKNHNKTSICGPEVESDKTFDSQSQQISLSL